MWINSSNVAQMNNINKCCTLLNEISAYERHLQQYTATKMFERMSVIKGRDLSDFTCYYEDWNDTGSYFSPEKGIQEAAECEVLRNSPFFLN